MPPQDDFTQLDCFINGNDDYIGLEVEDADTGDVLGSAPNAYSTDECTVVLFQDQGVWINLTAYTDATDAVFGCEISPIAELPLGEDYPVMFVDGTAIPCITRATL